MKELHVIARTPSPFPSRSPSPERDADGFTAAERAKKHERMARKLREQLARVEAQATEERLRSGGNVRIKREPEDDGNAERRKRTRNTAKPAVIETIDLTLTDDEDDEWDDDE